MAVTIWITESSKTEKVSTGKAFYKKLRSQQNNVFYLTEERFRGIASGDLTVGSESQLKNAFCMARLCQFLNTQGIDVICSAKSLFPEVYNWCRNNINQYFQVHIKDEQVNVFKADLTIKNNEENDLFHEKASEEILSFFERKVNA